MSQDQTRRKVHQIFYREEDQSKGFKIYDELELHTQERDQFVEVIQKINKLYHKCSQKHTLCFLQQPADQSLLQHTTIALCIAILLAAGIKDDFVFLSICFGIFGWTGHKIYEYFATNNECKQRFEGANNELSTEFRNIHEKFQRQNPLLKLVLHRQWNLKDQIIREYIQIVGSKILNTRQKNENSLSSS